MRTTLTLDDDLAGLLKQRAQELGAPFKEAVNRTIRAGLGECGVGWAACCAEDRAAFLRVPPRR
jgi:hypothetical protein